MLRPVFLHLSAHSYNVSVTFTKTYCISFTQHLSKNSFPRDAAGSWVPPTHFQLARLRFCDTKMRLTANTYCIDRENHSKRIKLEIFCHDLEVREWTRTPSPVQYVLSRGNIIRNTKLMWNKSSSILLWQKWAGTVWHSVAIKYKCDRSNVASVANIQCKQKSFKLDKANNVKEKRKNKDYIIMDSNQCKKITKI